MRAILFFCNTAMMDTPLAKQLLLRVHGADDGETARLTNELLTSIQRTAPDCQATRAEAEGEPVVGSMGGVELAIGALIVQILATPAIVQLVEVLRRKIVKPHIHVEIVENASGKRIVVDLDGVTDPQLVDKVSTIVTGQAAS